MITGDTITDEQIRELHEEAWRLYVDTCNALGFNPNGGKVGDPGWVRAARYRCADTLNARSKKP